jgi:hypothetical protein
MRSGKLPHQVPNRFFAGPGRGKRCVICEAVVESREIEYELFFLEDEAASDQAPSVHVRCFDAWHSVCLGMEAERRSEATSAGPTAVAVSQPKTDRE